MPQTGTVMDRLESLAAVLDRGFSFRRESGEVEVLPFSELCARASAGAEVLRGHGVKVGDRVALVLPEPADFVPCLFAIMWAGAIPVPLAPPLNQTRSESWSRDVAAILAVASASAVVTSEAVLPLLGGAVLPAGCQAAMGVEVLTRATLSHGIPLVPRGLSDLAVLQFTSGSTRQPRGVMVSHGNLTACVSTRVGVLGLDAEHVHVGWLPLHHDMGLVSSVFTTVMVGDRAMVNSPLSFLRDPLSWMRDVHELRAGSTLSPPFALGLTVRRLQSVPLPDWDLSCLSVLTVGGEPLPAAALRAFAETMAPLGFDPLAITPGYGSAEATLSISFSRQMGVRTDVVDPVGLAAGRAESAASGVEIVSCGAVMPGHEIRIVGDDGAELLDRAIGNVTFRGPSVAGGYLDDPAATAEVFRAGWLWPGDLGYVADGQVFITGRAKDLIIVNGRNVAPHLIEWAVEQAAGVRLGSVAAFSIPGSDTEQVIVALESHDADAALVERVRVLVAGQLQLMLADVVVLRPGQLPKTTSGKVQRQRARGLYLAGELASAAPASRPDLATTETASPRPAGARPETHVVAGHSVLLADVERELISVPAVADAHVVARADAGNPVTLHAYVTAESGQHLHPSVIRGDLARRLPAWLIPATVTVVQSFTSRADGGVDVLPLEHVTRVMTVREAELLAVWRDVLQRNDIGLDDDFFALGGDSVKAMEVMAELQHRHEMFRPVTLLLEAPTVAGLAATLDAGLAGQVVVPLGTAGDQLPLFLTHGGNGQTLYGRALRAHVSQRVPLYGLRAPLTGRNDNLEEKTLEELAARYMAALIKIQPVGPYRLFGYSAGGQVAYEIATQLERDGRTVQLLVLGDTASPGFAGGMGWNPARNASRAAALSFRWQQLRHGGATRKRQLATMLLRNQLRHQGRLLAAHARRIPVTDSAMQQPQVKWAEQVKPDIGKLIAFYRPARRVVGPILLVRAGLDQTGDLGWSAFSQALTIRPIDAQHLTLVREPHVAALAAVINDALGVAIN